jgi:hypothetical protein
MRLSPFNYKFKMNFLPTNKSKIVLFIFLFFNLKHQLEQLIYWIEQQPPLGNPHSIKCLR